VAESIMDWLNKCCAKCRKPLVFEKHPHTEAYDGWRLDCDCWDERPARAEDAND
jgi:hypothetical protein